MDRKKFIKACMGAGIQRDIAAQLAATTRKKGASYFEGLAIFLTTYAVFLNSDPNPAATDVHPWLVSAPLRDWQRRGTA